MFENISGTWERDPDGEWAIRITKGRSRARAGRVATAVARSGRMRPVLLVSRLHERNLYEVRRLSRAEAERVVEKNRRDDVRKRARRSKKSNELVSQSQPSCRVATEAVQRSESAPVVSVVRADEPQCVAPKDAGSSAIARVEPPNVTTALRGVWLALKELSRAVFSR